LIVLVRKIEDRYQQRNLKDPNQEFTPQLPELNTSEISDTVERDFRFRMDRRTAYCHSPRTGHANEQLN
jgi:hypothetical protein